ncbi:MAG: protease modulator HflC [Erysipelotrichia bacterium]|nr:protease modulator HflC [Candidatus Riflebacteria bacterium]NCB38508.1 protease modulator HflC [Erysipelotrichia bacterium]
MNRFVMLIIVLLLAASVAGGLFVVDEGQQAIVTRFGKPVGEVRYAGLGFKIPFIEQVHRFEKRILKWDGDPNQITTKEKKFIWVDTTARWRIKDPLKFYMTVASISGAQSRLDDIIDSVVRDAISGNYLVDLVRGATYKAPVGGYIVEEVLESAGRRNREQILSDILEKASASTPEYGIELIDVQVKRLNYIDKVLEKVYERMISERNKVAAEYRSEGEGTKAEILGQMEKELRRIRSEAFKTATEIKGKADASAASIYADAYNRDAEFYTFFKTLESIEKTATGNSKMVISTDSEFFRYFKDSKLANP